MNNSESTAIAINLPPFSLLSPASVLLPPSLYENQELRDAVSLNFNDLSWVLENFSLLFDVICLLPGNFCLPIYLFLNGFCLLPRCFYLVVNHQSHYHQPFS
ncbi:hypothetical protein [Leptodesmis sp.]|uniref:hypothetical protein n=1 Tax=Leptodesmis sp. TaxID=3100501 RepID=UPI0040534694